MILTIPYQGLEVGNIHLNTFQDDKYGKSIARLTYKDSSVELHDVSIMTPPLKVLSYNPDSSKLVLDVSDQELFFIKLTILHEYIISTFYIHQQNFLNQNNLHHDDIRNIFHSLITDNTLTLYIYSTNLIKRANSTFCKITDLKAGDMIRCVIRIHGITQVFNKRFPNSVRLRIQHSVPNIWLL